MSTPWSAARRTLHTLLSRPAHFMVGSATLALAVAVFFATFALVDGLLLTPPAFHHHRDVVLYGEAVRPDSVRSMSARAYQSMGLPTAARSRGLASGVERASVRAGTYAGFLAIQRVDGGFLPTLGVIPALGGITLTDGRRDGVLVSWDLWQAWFTGATTLGDEQLTVDGQVFPIVGVLPPSYRFLEDVDVLLPLRIGTDASVNVPNDIAVARLAAGASATSLARQVKAYATSGDGKSADYGVTPVDTALTESSAPTLWLLLGCSVLVLAMAGGNLANLVLARALGRGKETALRRALGANFWGAWAGLAAETIVIGMTGLVLGTLAGHAIVAALDSHIPGNWRVNAGTLGISFPVYAASTLAAAAVATFAAAGGTLHEHGDAHLRECFGGSRSQRERLTARGIRIVLVQFQLALATLLLSLCVTRLIESWRLRDVDPGFDQGSAVVARFRPDSGHFGDARQVAGLMAAVAHEAAGARGVVAAGISTQLPAGTSFSAAFSAAPASAVEAQFAVQTPGARRALGLPLIAGRDLLDSDRLDSQAVAVVNQAFMAQVPGAALGGRVSKVSRSLGNRTLRIVGVVGDTRNAGPGTPARPMLIVPFAQLPGNEFEPLRNLLAYYLVFRAKDDAALAGLDAADVLHSLAPWLVADTRRTLARVWRDAYGRTDRDAWLAGLFASVGLGLAVVGVYSAQRVEMTSRQRDVDLCAALGAMPGSLVGLYLSRVIGRASVGIAIGLLIVAAWGLPLDPLTAPIVGSIMLVLTTAASLPPIWRAARTPALLALRNP